MSAPQMTAPLAGCVTIDSMTPDGYLDNARAGTPQAGANATTEEAVQNWLAMLAGQPSTATATLVGHGAEGLIQTGAAQGQVISLHNQPTWTPLLNSLRGKVIDLYLFGATVGAGEEGAQLLHAIAQASGAAAYAPTGLLYCNAEGDFYLEAGAVWQVATPEQLPSPINPPQQALESTDQESGDPTPHCLGEPGGKITSV